MTKRDPRIEAAAKALHRYANPDHKSTWARSDKRAYWRNQAKLAVDAADAVRPKRLPLDTSLRASDG